MTIYFRIETRHDPERYEFLLRFHVNRITIKYLLLSRVGSLFLLILLTFTYPMNPERDKEGEKKREKKEEDLN